MTTQDSGRVKTAIQIAYPSDGGPTKWKIIISQRLSHRSETSESHVRLSILEIWHLKDEPLEHLALKANGAWGQKFHRLGDGHQKPEEPWSLENRDGKRGRLDKIRQQRSMLQTKEQHKTPKEKPSGDRQPNQKRIVIYPKENSE